MVIIRQPCKKNTEDFLRAVQRSRSLHRGWVSPPHDVEKYLHYLNRLRRKNQKGFLVLTDETNELVGVINVNEIVLGDFKSAFLGYYAFIPFAGRGLMHLGMQQVISLCFHQLGLHRLEANIQPGNKRSIILVQGLGFRLEGFSPRYLKICGRWRDHQRWAILAEDWKGK